MKATGSLIALQSVLALAPLQSNSHCCLHVVRAEAQINWGGSLYCPMTPGTTLSQEA